MQETSWANSLSIRCLHNQNVDVDEDSTKNDTISFTGYVSEGIY